MHDHNPGLQFDGDIDASPPSRARDCLRAASCFIRQITLLLLEVPVVWYFMAKLKANALPDTHPWVTGKLEDQQGKIWARNIVYRSATRSAETAAICDVELTEATGAFLAKMVAKSCRDDEVAYGPKRRMPHAVNYIHGAVHHNGLFMVFDDFADLVRHLRDQKFRKELRRVAKLERREVTFLLRQRDYDPLEFANCVGVVRNYLPWFSNGNGPTKRPVLWGNMAPFPAVNLINGAWIDDLHLLLAGKQAQLLRAPLAADHGYFRSSYGAGLGGFRLLDRLQAWYMYTDVRLRGFRGQLFFANRHKIEPHRIAEYEAAGGYGRWSACHEVPFPLQWSPHFPFVRART
jgi:hypothetical protein